MYGDIGKLTMESIRASVGDLTGWKLSAVADNTSLYLHNSSNDTQPHSIMLWSHQASQQTNSGRIRDQPGLPTMYVFMYVHDHICLDFKYGPRNRGSFVHSQSIQKENKRTFRTQIKCHVENVRQNPLGNWVIFIFNGEKPCTRII